MDVDFVVPKHGEPVDVCGANGRPASVNGCGFGVDHGVFVLPDFNSGTDEVVVVCA